MVNTDAKLDSQDRPEAEDLRQRCDTSGSGPPKEGGRRGVFPSSPLSG